MRRVFLSTARPFLDSDVPFHVHRKYSFKAKRPKLTDPAKDERDIQTSVRTLSALLTQGDPNIIPTHPSLAEHVTATLSEELVMALAHQHQQQGGPHSRMPYPDELEPDEEDELEDDQYESGPEHGSPRYRQGGGSRGPSPVGARTEAHAHAQADQGEKGGPGGEVQVMIVEGLDGEAFPIPLRARKGKEAVGAPAVVSGVKRKR